MIGLMRIENNYIVVESDLFQEHIIPFIQI